MITLLGTLALGILIILCLPIFAVLLYLMLPLIMAFAIGSCVLDIAKPTPPTKEITR